MEGESVMFSEERLAWERAVIFVALRFCKSPEESLTEENPLKLTPVFEAAMTCCA
jgi:hypothetical protein